MLDEEKKDILFDIDMQLYNEFNDKLAEMYDHIGDVYSLREIEEIEQAEKDRERELLRKFIKTQQKEIEELKEKNISLEEENNFLKMMYRGTSEFKSIEKLAKEE